MPVQPSFRLLTGGTAPDDVAALHAALAERLVQRGLITAGSEPLSGIAGGREPMARPLPLLVPIGPGENPEQVRVDLTHRVTQVPPRADLVLRTSGSTTGTGRLIAMSSAALVASARATLERLGGPGTWILPLPVHHVAGLQILIRSIVAGTEPVVVDTGSGFSPTALAAALRAASGAAESADGRGAGRLYVSLVPTQLVHVLRDPAASRALAEADAVLLGGAAADPALLARARQAGVTVATTYGMSETGGGCVYDGRPLDGVGIAIQDPAADGAGRILISGPVLAEGCLSSADCALDDAGERFRQDAGRRVLATSDRGRLRPDGRLEVLGRMDDVIITGGVKVEPRYVEEALTGLETVAEACVVGLPDEQWGRLVAAAVVCEPAAGQVDGAALREAVRARLDGAHTPKRVVVLESLPLRPSGKVDRRAVARLLAAADKSAQTPAAAAKTETAERPTPEP